MNKTMEQNHNITDEQIARFVASTASEEERNAVLEYMSQNDENLEEVMAIVESVQAQSNSNQAIKQSNNHAVAWRIAASVAVILIAGSAWMLLRDRGANLAPQPGSTIALNTTPTPSPDISATDAQDHSTLQPANPSGVQPSQSLIADAAPVATTPSMETNNIHRQEPTPTARTSEDILMASSEVLAKTTNPIKTEQDIVFRTPVPTEWKPGTDITFSFNCSAPVINLMFIPIHDKGNIYKKRITSDSPEWKAGKFVAPANLLKHLTSKSDAVMWRMEAYFNGGEKTVKYGEIAVIK